MLCSLLAIFRAGHGNPFLKNKKYDNMSMQMTSHVCMQRHSATRWFTKRLHDWNINPGAYLNTLRRPLGSKQPRVRVSTPTPLHVSLLHSAWHRPGSTLRDVDLVSPRNVSPSFRSARGRPNLTPCDVVLGSVRVTLSWFYTAWRRPRLIPRDVDLVPLRMKSRRRPNRTPRASA